MTKLETEAGYQIGQCVKFVDPCFGEYMGTVRQIRRYGKDKKLMVVIDHDNGDVYNFYPIDLNNWNN